MTPGGPLVSVVIPAFNAERWIDETLTSVRGQSHGALEIIVVDDGSTDGTAAVAGRHAAVDPRVRVVEQANAGVAAARNHGTRIATSDLLAFVDADDLWAPDKIARQLRSLEAAPDAALSYCWFACIDETGAIIDIPHQGKVEGDVLLRLFEGNFIGNGSSMLVRRAALERAGGFDSGLRAADAQGCEDYLLFCRIAEHAPFVCVDAPLLGYRQLAGNMSSDQRRMIRSWRMVMAEMAGRHPEHHALLRQGLRNYVVWLARRAVFARAFGRLSPMLGDLRRNEPDLLVAMLTRDLPILLRDCARAAKRRLGREWRRRRAGAPSPAAAQDRRFEIASQSAA